MNKLLLLKFFVALALSCDNNDNNEFNYYYASNLQNKTYGKVISIIDGDTYDILIEGNKTIRIRMDGIDAPEKGMPYYKVAKNYLANLCFQKTIKFIKTDDDKHGRVVAKTYLDDGRELGQEMIRAGYAWHFKKYSSDKIFSNLESSAKNKKIGLWADKRPIAPWLIRRLHRKGISTKSYFK